MLKSLWTLVKNLLILAVVIAVIVLLYKWEQYVGSMRVFIGGLFFLGIGLVSIYGLFAMMIEKIKERKFAAAFGLLLGTLLFAIFVYFIITDFLTSDILNEPLKPSDYDFY